MDLDRSFTVSRVGSGLALLIALALCFGAARLGSAFTEPFIPTWYAGLQKPSFTPPNWAFPVVWSALFLLMALAFWRVVVRLGGSIAPQGPVLAFTVQLALNVLWSFVFFANQSPAGGLLVIVLLIAAIVWTIIRFLAVDRLAGALLVPYLLWVGYAAVLNAAIWRLN